MDNKNSNKRNYRRALLMARVIRYIAMTLIILLVVLMLIASCINLHHVDVILFLGYIFAIAFCLFWMFSVCPRCNKLLFQKQSDRLMPERLSINPFSDKCVNCGLHFREKDFIVKAEKPDKNVTSMQ